MIKKMFSKKHCPSILTVIALLALGAFIGCFTICSCAGVEGFAPIDAQMISISPFDQVSFARGNCNIGSNQTYSTNGGRCGTVAKQFQTNHC